MTNFKGQYHYANGKRKTSVSRVRLYKGTGEIVVNGKSIKEWADTDEQIQKIVGPLILTGTRKDFDISITVIGSGTNAQAEAIRHGIAKALIVFNPELRTTLKPAGYLSRDARKKERKKFGLKKARKSPQFSKR